MHGQCFRRYVSCGSLGASPTRPISAQRSSFRPGVRTLEMGLLMQGSTTERMFFSQFWPHIGGAAGFNYFLYFFWFNHILVDDRFFFLGWIETRHRFTIERVFFWRESSNQKSMWTTILMMICMSWRWPSSWDCNGNRELVNLVRKASKLTSVGDPNRHSHGAWNHQIQIHNFPCWNSPTRFHYRAAVELPSNGQLVEAQLQLLIVLIVMGRAFFSDELDRNPFYLG